MEYDLSEIWNWRSLRILRYTLAALVVLLVAAFFLVSWAARSEPVFYREALETPPERLAEEGRKAASKITDLEKAVQRTDKPWTVEWSESELNGYLATELPRQGSLPKGFEDPRLKIDGDTVHLGFRMNYRGLSGLVSLATAVSVPEPNCIRIRIRQAALGKFPLPVSRVFEEMRQAFARRSEFDVETDEEQGDPVLVLRVRQKSVRGYAPEIRQCEIVDGTLRISGMTKRVEQKK